MRIVSMRVYEGNNIKKQRHVIKICLDQTNRSEIRQFLKTYFRVCFLLGFNERFIDIDKQGDIWEIWVTYTQEELSKYIIKNSIFALDTHENLARKAASLVKKGFIYSIIKKCKNYGVPFIEVGEDSFQLGFGKNSVIIRQDYQSYEDDANIEITRNMRDLWNHLKYSHIPRADGRIIYNESEINNIQIDKYPVIIRAIDKRQDIRLIIRDEDELKRVIDNMLNMYTRVFLSVGEINYRVICFKGEPGLIFKNKDGFEKLDITSEKLEIIEIINALERLKEFCKKIYTSNPIEFMYIDIMDEDELKVVDMGCAFDILDKGSGIEEDIIDYYINSLKIQGVGLIPIISVTGTNGKTSTSRLIHNLLCKLGFSSGLACTGGIFVRNNRLRSGDTTGFLSARDILKNKGVEAAVLETARGGIYKNGLGYEKAKVGIITSISEDHIGMEGVKDIQDLINIKSVVLDELDLDGKAVIKAQRELVELVKDKKNVCMFSIDKNEFIDKHINDGGEALYLEKNTIVWHKNGGQYKYIDIEQLPFTHKGISTGNILNIMAALAAVSMFVDDSERILKALSDIKCDLSTNPGRQNILEFGDYKVILDYGHNSEAFNEVLSIAKNLNPSRLTSIITAPGDRMDKYIKELGTIAAGFSDKIIVREQADLRGRQPGESSKIIKSGVLEKGFDEKDIIIILKEEEAIVHAMKNAIKDEVIVLFTQCLDIVIPAINTYLESIGKEKIGEGLNFSH